MNTLVQSQSTAYHLKTCLRILLAFLYLLLTGAGCLLLMLLVEIVQAQAWEGLYGWLSGACLTLFFAYGTVPLWKTRLELSPEGVTYTNPGFCRIYTPWENIEQITRVTRFRTSIVFLLRTPATSTTHFLEGKQSHLAVIERCSLLVTKAELLRHSFWIDGRAVITRKDLKNGTFKTYLQRYAPHLSLESITT